MTQWQNFLKNLGEWQGSFTQISAGGEVLNDVPSQLILEEIEGQEKVRLTLRRWLTDTIKKVTPSELIREYETLGRDILFFDNGAFSLGTIQVAPYTNFGAEFSFMHQDRRMRLVELFLPDGSLSQFTLIREKRAGSKALERPALTIDQLLGEWRGEGITIYPDWRNPETFTSILKIEKISPNKISQQIYFEVKEDWHTFCSEGVLTGNQIHFAKHTVMLLPDGASGNIPQKIQLHEAFFLEAGWLVEPNLRQRMIRRYNQQGEWESLTLITETKT